MSTGRFAYIIFIVLALISSEINAKDELQHPKVMHISGAISAQALSKVRFDLIAFRNTDPFPAGLIVLLDSTGGDGDAAMAIGRLLRQHNAHVFVTNRCDSACVLVFMGGVVRAANPNALGVHAGRLTMMMGDGKVVREIDASRSLDDSFQLAGFNRDVRIYLQEMGIGHGILDVMLAHPTMQVYKLSSADMTRYQVTGFENRYLNQRIRQLDKLGYSRELNRVSFFTRTMSVPRLCQAVRNSSVQFVECYRKILFGIHDSASLAGT